ncbi:MAG: hypothetical protein OES12_10260 [Anaerolineae bacterium]|jgi:hypothetical protein|nr:hypothetical protein [Anaerolineae bacterium]
MRTIDEQFSRDTSFWQRLMRDLRLLSRIFQMLYAYLVLGGSVRRKYRAKAARGEIFWVDEELSR